MDQLYKHQRIPRAIPEASAGVARTCPCQGWRQDCCRLLRSLSRAASSTLPPQHSLQTLHSRAKGPAPFAPQGSGKGCGVLHSSSFPPAQHRLLILPESLLTAAVPTPFLIPK